MKEINIGYLYYDILNLYGESGNIKALKHQLENQGLKVNVYFQTIKDKIDFNIFDLVYIGAGTEENLKIVIEDILKYKTQIKEYINNNKFFLATGNSINMFGEYLLEKDKTILKTLNIFDYYIEEEEFRMIDESILKADFLTKPLIGFQNQDTTLKNNNHFMFEVIKGVGSFPNSKTEGIRYKHFYGTYLLGPLLARNPEYLEYLVKEIIDFKHKKFKYKKFDLELDNQAYNKFISNFYKEIIE